jgi:hypothetical protein
MWNLNDIDGSPIPSFDGTFLYVGTNAGTLKAIKLSDRSVTTYTPGTGSGAVNGMPWSLSYNPVGAGGGNEDQIIFTQSTYVQSVSWNGTSFGTVAAKTWTNNMGAVTVSAPVDDGNGNLYVGGSDGKVHMLAVSNPGTDLKQVTIPGPGGTVGSPAFDVTRNTIYVGATDGHIYSFATPF